MEIIVGPYLQNVSRDRVTVMWHTSAPATSCLEFERADALGWSAYEGRPAPTYAQHIHDDRPVTVHAVTADGLAEDQLYYYRVRSEDPSGRHACSDGASFRTAPGAESPFSFVSYGDDMGVAEAHRRNAELARAYRPDICIGTGDAAQDFIGRYRADFFDCNHELLKYSPWFATMGNHDTPNEGYAQYFSFPEPRYWYSFDYGCAHITVANSNLDYRPGSEQWAWLEHDLSACGSARWKYVFFHHPPYCSNNCEIAATRVLCPLFDRYGVDVVYNAHATIYERSHPLRDGQHHPDGTTYLVSGGGGYDVSQSPGELWDHRHRISAIAKSTNHFLLTSVTPDQCRIRAIDTDDRIIDDFALTKPPGDPPEPPPSQPGPPRPRPEAGAVIAGLEEGASRWMLPWPQHSVDGDVSHSGGASIRWTHASGEPVLPALRRALIDDGHARAVAGGKSYEISAWVKTESVAGGVTLSFSWSGDMGFLGRTTSEPVSGTNDWTPVTITTPPLPEHVYWCRVVLSATPGSCGAAWFDDVRIVEASAGR